MDVYGSPQQMWEVMEVAGGMQGEVLQHAVHAQKRPAYYDGSVLPQPDAKRQMNHAGQHGPQSSSVPNAQYYQQAGGYYGAYSQQQEYYGYAQH
jgi:hypothetical protein